MKKESGKDFMLDAKYGFIHACPTNLGTGTSQTYTTRGARDISWAK